MGGCVSAFSASQSICPFVECESNLEGGRGNNNNKKKKKASPVLFGRDMHIQCTHRAACRGRSV